MLHGAVMHLSLTWLEVSCQLVDCYDVHTAAEDRRELLRRYKEAKQQQASNHQPHLAGTSDVRLPTGRLSLGGRPPMPAGKGTLAKLPMPTSKLTSRQGECHWICK